MDSAHLRVEAANCRTLAKGARDRMTARNLLALAEEYEAEAQRFDLASELQPSIPIRE
jgi:hypothetical protein